jgi:hypothetical protein
MKVILDVNTIHFIHIREVLEFCEKLTLKDNNLSLLTFSYPTYDIFYQIYHNKKSFTISSHEQIKH